ncbi:DUF4224 domain-containing protein [Verticiella sediminum]|nr:DUF4224 domain-containing protein [Verticiella sediminum]
MAERSYGADDAYLTASELASLVGCKPNQRSMMSRWLDRNRWRWVPGRDGLPRVAREYHDKKLGITDGRHEDQPRTHRRLASEPNQDAFAGMGAHRR